MTRFNKVVLSDDKSTVAVGPGLIWDDVYGALNGTGVNAPGGRVPGVGVAGFTLGGGELPQKGKQRRTCSSLSRRLHLPDKPVRHGD